MASGDTYVRRRAQRSAPYQSPGPWPPLLTQFYPRGNGMMGPATWGHLDGGLPPQSIMAESLREKGIPESDGLWG